jgi:tetratricopeptide (TPR) repeat protein
MRRLHWTLLLVLLVTLSLTGAAAAQSLTPNLDPTACKAGRDYAAVGQEAFAARDYIAAYDAFNCALAETAGVETLLVQRAESALLATFLQDVSDRPYENRVRVAGSYAPLENIEGLFGDMLDGYSREMRRTPDDPSLYIRRAYIQWLRGQDDAAQADYARVLELLPENPFGYLFRGSSAVFNGDTQAGMRDFDTALAYMNRVEYLYFVISLSLSGVGLYEDVIDYAGRALEQIAFAPSQLDARIDAYIMLEQYEDALADVQALFDQMPEPNVDMYLDRARILWLMDDLEPALESINTAIEMDPSQPRLFKLRASIYSWMEGGERAAAADAAAIIDLMATQQQTLETLYPGDTLLLELAAGLVYRLPLAVEAGGSYAIAVQATEQTGRAVANPLLLLLDTDSTAGLAALDSGDEAAGMLWTDAYLPSFLPPETGNYELLITTDICGCGGTVQVSVVETGSAPPDTALGDNAPDSPSSDGHISIVGVRLHGQY